MLDFTKVTENFQRDILLVILAGLVILTIAVIWEWKIKKTNLVNESNTNKRTTMKITLSNEQLLELQMGTDDVEIDVYQFIDMHKELSPAFFMNAKVEDLNDFKDLSELLLSTCIEMGIYHIEKNQVNDCNTNAEI